jgi:hypothetical protein
MNAIQAIQAAAASSDRVLKSYVGDLTDAELLHRPHAECNCIAWQLGHLVVSQWGLLKMLHPSVTPPALPEGFAEKHGRENADRNNPEGFWTKDEYLALYDAARAATLEVLDGINEADLDAPNPFERFREVFPTVGSMYLLAATHPMMHAGQFVPVRRELGKPVVI